MDYTAAVPQAAVLTSILQRLPAHLSGALFSAMAQPDHSYPKLLSLAVHELRTPASVVSGYLRMLQRDRDSPLSERQRRMIDEAEKSCARMVALIAELSEVVKLDAGLIAMSRQPLDLFPLAAGVVSGVHASEDREVHLRVDGTASGASLAGDAPRLQQALHSIFRAVLRETAGPASVVADRRIVGSGPQRAAVIVIAEAGRVHGAYDEPRGEFDEKRGGLGLELPLARRIIEAHGGRVWSPAGAGSDGDSDTPAARGAAVISLPLSG